MHVVEPDRLIAGWWSVMSSLLVAGALWLVVDGGFSWHATGLLIVSLIAWSWFVVQALVPHRLRFEIDEVGLRGHALWRRIELSWSDVRMLRVDRLVGEPVLEVALHADATNRIIPLPIGTPLAQLHAALERLLGPPTSTPDATRH
ncbi:MAG: hypothetical protein R3249_00370 [Nitriliruptorales bacterium]|nr:hypothetical protein [Nitriliruptorales bacterium]